MTVKSQITAATSQFTDTTVFGETMTFYPKGDANNKVDFDGVLDEDSLPGTNETRGDGRILNNSVERRERRSAIVECPISLKSVVQSQQDPKRPDLIKDASGNMWGVKRFMGEDHAMFALLVVRNETAVETYGKTRRG